MEGVGSRRQAHLLSRRSVQALKSMWWKSDRLGGKVIDKLIA